MGIEKIIFDNNLYAIVVKHNYSDEGIKFFTPDDFSQQLAYMNRPKGYEIQPHYHNLVERKVSLTQEVLVIKKGHLYVDFYDLNESYKGSIELITGDIILLASGGHGFRMIENTEIIEVKQGPYSGELDKTRFNSKINIL
jgi:hypothetical protein